jgi:hypothetical protein
MLAEDNIYADGNVDQHSHCYDEQEKRHDTASLDLEQLFGSWYQPEYSADVVGCHYPKDYSNHHFWLFLQS